MHQQGRGKFKIAYDRIAQAVHEDGSLHVVCEVEFVPPGSMWKATTDSKGVDKQPIPSVDLKPLLETSMLSDCIIKIGDDLLKCHRCVLGLHSDVFRQMFEHTTTTESRSGVVEMPDTTEPAARTMLEYMYTGSITKLDKHATDLLALAEKYGMIKLKDICEGNLCTAINTGNACQMLIFADTYRAQRVRDAAIKFISENHGQLLDTMEWKTMKESNPLLASDILEVVLGGCGTPRSLSVSFTASLASTSGTGSGAAATDTGSDDAPAETKPPPRKRTRRNRL